MSALTTHLGYRRLKNLQFRLRRRLRWQAKRLQALLPRDYALPDFLIIGADKCGTTSLFKYLGQHPGICLPATKEIDYFSNPMCFRYGERWYGAHFPTRGTLARRAAAVGYMPLTGEATPALYSHNYAIQSAALVPQAKLVALLRNPVDRAWSHYQHNRRAVFGDRLPFWEALMAEEARAVQHAAHRSQRLTPGWDGTADLSRYAYAQRGMYKRQLETWLQYFPREQLLILCYEQFIAEPAATCRRVADHLGLPPFAYDVSTRYNPGHYTQPMEQRCRDYLTELLRPHNRALFEFLGQDWGWPS